VRKMDKGFVSMSQEPAENQHPGDAATSTRRVKGIIGQSKHRYPSPMVSHEYLITKSHLPGNY
jgi:hypothetical protein